MKIMYELGGCDPSQPTGHYVYLWPNLEGIDQGKVDVKDLKLDQTFTFGTKSLEFVYLCVDKCHTRSWYALGCQLSHNFTMDRLRVEKAKLVRKMMDAASDIKVLEMWLEKFIQREYISGYEVIEGISGEVVIEGM